MTGVQTCALPICKKLGRDGRNHCFQIFVSNAEAPFILLCKIALIIGRIVEFIFVFNIHGAGVASFSENGKEALPIDRALTRDAESPPAGIVDRLNAAFFNNVP